MVAYATHTVHDGKWKVTVWRRYQPDIEAHPDCPDLREVISRCYSAKPLELATIVLESVLHCERVHVELLSGEGIYAEKLSATYRAEGD